MRQRALRSTQCARALWLLGLQPPVEPDELARAWKQRVARSHPDLHALSDSEPGDHVRLERVTEQVEIDLESLTYLSTHGFIPGTDAKVRAKAPDGTLTLDIGDDTLALGPALAQNLYVSAR